MSTKEPNRLNRLYRHKEMLQFVALKKTQLAELIREGKFPKPIQLTDGGRAIAWLESDLIAWQNGRIAARNSEAA
jgi:prophage regulatory protein